MRKNTFFKVAALAIAVVLVGCGGKAEYEPSQQSGANPPLPKPENFLVPPMQVPNGVGWKEGQTPKVAEGLKIEKIASGLKHPRRLLALSNGDVLVVEGNSPGEAPVTSPKGFIAGKVKGLSGKAKKGGNRITLLRPTAEGEWEKHTLVENLHSPFGIQLIGETLYVANTGAIVAFPFQVGQTKITEAPVEFADLPNTINHHWTKALLASPDGKKLYVGVGSNSNITENGMGIEYRRATVLEVDVATRGSRVYASGLRNPTGLAWEPQADKLWAIVNERDEIGADLVPDYMTSVQDGGFYGWPYSYFGQNVDSRVAPQRPDLVAKAISPDYALGSHVAALGLLFSEDNALLATYHDGAFVSEHGSWDRSPLSGYEVVFVPFKDGVPVGEPKVVVSGFHSGDEKQLYGAPVGLAQDTTGALLIADDVGDTIWRVTSK